VPYFCSMRFRIVSESICKRSIVLISRLADSWRSNTLSFLPLALGIASASRLVPANVIYNLPTPVAFWQLRIVIQELDL